ncbi:MAG: serine/threonine-protein kinase [Thermoanaerobaculales bacterium]|nr:serine/threonine-protein kinase [Thermoanaerobaculales bacterium]
MDTLVGTSIRNIRITELVGAGGMGEVYLGIDEVLGRQVAVKVIRAAMRPDAKVKSRFVREARLLSQLDHPNICRIYEFIEGQDCDFIVLELVQGETLKDAIDRGQDDARKFEIAGQVAEALRAAHSMSVVHRDLKPDNIMVGPDGGVKVLDFGLARSLPREDPEIEASGSHTFDAEDPVDTPDGTMVTELGRALGTPRYMSPEQARGQAITAASDVYSLGLIFQELFTGRPPYEDGLAMEKLVAKAMWGETETVRGLDAELTRLIEDMKSLVPGRRPSVEAVAERLRRIRDRPRRLRRRLAAGTVAAVLALAAVVSTFGFVHARRSQRAAEDARSQAEAVNAFLRTMLESASPTVEGVDVKVVEVLDEAALNLGRGFSGRPLDRAAVLHTLGATYLALGEYETSIEHLTAAAELRRRRLGPDAEDTLATELQIGRARFDMGEIDDGEQILREVLQRCSRSLGPDELLCLAAAQEVAGVLVSRGDYDEAEPMLERVVAGRRGILGEDDPLSISSREALGVLYRRQGRYDEAVQIHRENLATKEELFGEAHPLTANTISNLATALMRAGDDWAAEEMYRRVVEIREEHYGTDHPAHLKAMGNLAMILARQKRYEEAEAAGLAHVAALRRVLGEEHPHTLIGENNLANTYRRWGRPETAEEIYRSVLERQLRVLGPDHLQTVRSLSNLAKNAYEMGRFDEAVELSREVAETRRRTLGEAHPFFLDSLFNVGFFLSKAERWEEAEPWLREALERNVRVRGNENYMTPMIADRLIMTLWTLDRRDEAEELLRERLPIRREVFGADHEATRRAAGNLVFMVRETGRDDEADQLEQELADASSS